MNEDRHRRELHGHDRDDPQENVPATATPLIIGGGMRDDQETTGQLLGDVLDLVGQATEHLTPDYIEDRLRQVMRSASAAPAVPPNGTASLTEPGEGAGSGTWGGVRPEIGGCAGGSGAEDVSAAPPTSATEGAGSRARDQSPAEMIEVARAEAARIVSDARRRAAQIVAAAYQGTGSEPSGETGAGAYARSTDALQEATPETASVTANEAMLADCKAASIAGLRLLHPEMHDGWAGLSFSPPGRQRHEALRFGPLTGLVGRRLLPSHLRLSWTLTDRTLADGLPEPDYSALARWLVRRPPPATLNRTGWRQEAGSQTDVLFRAWLAYAACRLTPVEWRTECDLADSVRARLDVLDASLFARAGLNRGDRLLVPFAAVSDQLRREVVRPSAVRVRGALVAADVLVPYPIPTLPPDQRIGDAVEHMVAADEHALPVHDGAAVIGVATMTDAVTAARRRPSDPVSSITRKPTVVDSATPIDTVRDRVLIDSTGLLVVLDQSGSIAGYITARTALAGHMETGDEQPPQGRLTTELYDPAILFSR